MTRSGTGVIKWALWCMRWHKKVVFPVGVVPAQMAVNGCRNFVIEDVTLAEAMVQMRPIPWKHALRTNQKSEWWLPWQNINTSQGEGFRPIKLQHEKLWRHNVTLRRITFDQSDCSTQHFRPIRLQQSKQFQPIRMQESHVTNCI